MEGRSSRGHNARFGARLAHQTYPHLRQYRRAAEPSGSSNRLPPPNATVTGLLPIRGWAFTQESVCPEGRVELSIDDEDYWVELVNRTHICGIDTSATWAGHGAYTVAADLDGRHRFR